MQSPENIYATEKSLCSYAEQLALLDSCFALSIMFLCKVSPRLDYLEKFHFNNQLDLQSYYHVPLLWKGRGQRAAIKMEWLSCLGSHWSEQDYSTCVQRLD